MKSQQRTNTQMNSVTCNRHKTRGLLASNESKHWALEWKMGISKAGGWTLRWWWRCRNFASENHEITLLQPCYPYYRQPGSTPVTLQTPWTQPKVMDPSAESGLRSEHSQVWPRLEHMLWMQEGPGSRPVRKCSLSTATSRPCLISQTHTPARNSSWELQIKMTHCSHKKSCQ